MKKLLFRFFKNQILDAMMSSGFRDWLIKEINREVDLPVLTEQQEAKLIEKMYIGISKFFLRKR
jgi:hypothetical protein